MIKIIVKKLFGKPVTYKKHYSFSPRLIERCSKGKCIYKFVYKYMGTSVYWCTNCITEKRVHANLLVRILDG